MDIKVIIPVDDGRIAERIVKALTDQGFYFMGYGEQGVLDEWVLENNPDAAECVEMCFRETKLRGARRLR